MGGISPQSDWEVDNVLDTGPGDHTGVWLYTAGSEGESALTPKMVKYNFEIISILTAAKNCTSNYSDTPFGPIYGTSSKASLMAPSNQI